MAETLAVIGGGVVGLNVALALQREGFAVTVYDRDEATDAATRGASHRNAGGFAFSDIFKHFICCRNGSENTFYDKKCD